jgi:DNA gyrase subunit B
MTDADVDGSHIKILILTFIFKYLRALIEKGHVYIAMPPLYRVVQGKQVHYLLDDKELADFKAANSSSVLEIGYLKGLGELDPPELKESTMDVTKRKIKKITLEDLDIATDMFDKLMGGSVVRRKSFIEANAHRANIDI